MFYWSPAAYPKPVSREYLYCDGGNLTKVLKSRGGKIPAITKI